MQTWNEFVKEIQAKYQLNRKDAMKKASPLWRKMKIKNRNKSKIKDVPKISEFPKVSKKKKKSISKMPSTINVRASELGGRMDVKSTNKKGYTRMRKKTFVLDSQKFSYLNGL